MDHDGNADESVAELRATELVRPIAGSFYGLNCRRRRSRKASHAFSRVSAFRPPKANRRQNTALFAAIKRQKPASDAQGMPSVVACVPDAHLRTRCGCEISPKWFRIASRL